MKQADLDKILKDHSLWLESDEREGKRANLRGANLCLANLSKANLNEANLRDADLYGANLSYADLSGAYLSGANLRLANLREANLSGAYLGKADLSYANLSGADLYGAKILSFQYNKQTAYYTNTNFIHIGCKTLTIDEWLANYKRIGKDQDYTKDEIRKYECMVSLLRCVLKFIKRSESETRIIRCPKHNNKGLPEHCQHS
jgi:hypothetical protein